VAFRTMVVLSDEFHDERLVSAVHEIKRRFSMHVILQLKFPTYCANLRLRG